MPATLEENSQRMTLTEVAVAANRAECTVRLWVSSGRLPATRVMGRIYVDRADLEKLLRGEAVAPLKAQGKRRRA